MNNQSMTRCACAVLSLHGERAASCRSPAISLPATSATAAPHLMASLHVFSGEY